MGIADLILARPPVEVGDDADLHLEDPELARELEELRARRARLDAARAPAAAAPAPGAGHAAAAPSAAPVVDVGAVKRSEEASPSAPSAPPRAQGRAAAPSLADALLARGGGDMERELEAMEEELQRNLAEYRRQRSDDAPAPAEAPAPAADSSPGKAARGRATLGATLGLSRGGAPAASALAAAASASAAAASASAASTPVRGDAAAADACGAEEAVPEELAAARAEAAVMEEAFPDDGQPAPERVRRYVPRTWHRGDEREAPPLDTDVMEMRGALDDLDARLRAIQSRQDELMPKASAEAAGSREMPRAIAEMRAQNDALRRCLASASERGGKGLLNFDRSLFAERGT